MQTWFGLENWMWIAIEAAAVALIVLLIVSAKVRGNSRHSRDERTGRLNDAFGPEYARTVGEKGRVKAEEDLEVRAKNAASIDLHPLSAIEGKHYMEEWAATQARFVDNPGDAVNQADRLVTEVLQARGYPAGNFEARADAVSVDHPKVVVEYRAAHDAAERNQRGDASTDDLRSAMTQYRAIFTELIDVRNLREPVASP